MSLSKNIFNINSYMKSENSTSVDEIVAKLERMYPVQYTQGVNYYVGGSLWPIVNTYCYVLDRIASSIDSISEMFLNSTDTKYLVLLADACKATSIKIKKLTPLMNLNFQYSKLNLTGEMKSTHEGIQANIINTIRSFDGKTLSRIAILNAVPGFNAKISQDEIVKLLDNIDAYCGALLVITKNQSKSNKALFPFQKLVTETESIITAFTKTIRNSLFEAQISSDIEVINSDVTIKQVDAPKIKEDTDKSEYLRMIIKYMNQIRDNNDKVYSEIDSALNLISADGRTGSNSISKVTKESIPVLNNMIDGSIAADDIRVKMILRQLQQTIIGHQSTLTVDRDSLINSMSSSVEVLDKQIKLLQGLIDDAVTDSSEVQMKKLQQNAVDMDSITFDMVKAPWGDGALDMLLDSLQESLYTISMNKDAWNHEIEEIKFNREAFVNQATSIVTYIIDTMGVNDLAVSYVDTNKLNEMFKTLDAAKAQFNASVKAANSVGMQLELLLIAFSEFAEEVKDLYNARVLQYAAYIEEHAQEMESIDTVDYTIRGDLVPKDINLESLDE